MKILQKYILKEMLMPCLLCLVILNFIFLAGWLVKAADLIIGRGIPLTETLKVLLLALPSMVSYTAPLSLLTGTLIVFGGFSQYNELRAMKAAGVHPVKFMMPAMVIGLLMAIMMFVFNDQVTPNARFDLRRSFKKIAIQHPMALIEPGRFVPLTESIIFYAKSVKNGELRDVVAHEGVDSENPVRTVIAERGKIVTDPKAGTMEIQLYDGTISENEKGGLNTVQFKTFKFPTLGKEDLSRIEKKKKEFSLSDLLVRIDEPNISSNDKLEYWITFHERIAFSLGAFIFVFVGIPIAVIVRRGEAVVSFAIAMAFAFLYYILFATAHAMAAKHVLPPYVAMWLPNVLLFVAGLFAVRKAVLV